MTGAPLPTDEYARLLDLAHYEVLDTPQEEAFDRITRLAAHLLGTPVALINFVDQYRQWGKSAVGLNDSTAPRQHSFCAWTILQSGPMVVEDATEDPRFKDNPQVTGDPHIHMYAGAPLITPAGHRIGSLCVTDDRPHPLTATDLRALQDLADLVVSELELRARTIYLERELQAQTHRSEELKAGLDQAHVLEGVTQLIDLDLTPEEMTVAASSLLGEALAADHTCLIVFEGDGLRVRAAHYHPRIPKENWDLSQHVPDWPFSLTNGMRDLEQPFYLDDYAAHPGALAAMVAVGVKQIAWLPLGTRDNTTSLLMAVRMDNSEATRWRNRDRTLLEAAGRSVRSALDRRLQMTVAHQEARIDVLTGTLNRRALDEDLAQFESRGLPFTLGLLDLDGLKVINDQQGHAQGDRLLQVFAQALTEGAGINTQVYRVGGDEFVVLGETCETQIQHAVDAAVLAARQVVPLQGASLGTVLSTEGQGNALLALADERMYVAKRQAALVGQH
ncbi:sensor domain-containing diguanylate cyclase [Deinococcus arenicola]|uniref:Sensor domain-containing diguanylate cyclase n=1 Tax=Deinococcus arenicola TaxID=2994950 RepID=A0ABU4DTN0_9DEIO|nr:sensor domain-containing diguanylate cyclase [Deinococcus sp. ZS9-10]MDV6375434.1 sensor domain-containing diguanylate cyclase [Deinococcus sp. ZS9-10]